MAKLRINKFFTYSVAAIFCFLVMFPFGVAHAQEIEQRRIKTDVFKKSKSKVKQVNPKLFKTIKISPKLEVQRLSGEFEQWGISMTINFPQSLKFRSDYAGSTANSAMWQVSEKQFPAGNAPLEQPVLEEGFLPQVPQKDKVVWFYIDFSEFVPSSPPSTPKEYYVRIVTLGANNKQVGWPSLPVTIVYQKPAKPGPIYLDSVQVTGISPSSGVIFGPPYDATSATLNNDNSIEISYIYDLNTEDEAVIRQWLLLENGTVAPNNFWTYAPIKKGVRKATTRATIKCKKGDQGETLIKAIKVKLTHKSAVLYEVTKPLPAGINFKC